MTKNMYFFLGNKSNKWSSTHHNFCSKVHEIVHVENGLRNICSKWSIKSKIFKISKFLMALNILRATHLHMKLKIRYKINCMYSKIVLVIVCRKIVSTHALFRKHHTTACKMLILPLTQYSEQIMVREIQNFSRFTEKLHTCLS